MDLDKISAVVGRKVESEAEALELLAKMKATADAGAEASLRVQELEAERLEREALEAVTKAIADGRLAESQKEWAISLFLSDRKAWEAYAKATAPGTFTSARKLPPQDRLTDDSTGDDGVSFPDSVKFFGTEIHVNTEQLSQLNKALQLSREKFGGDLARAIRAVRR